MYVLEVIPLSVLPPQVPQVLTYYSDSNLPKGAVVQIPLHNRNVVGIVINSAEIDKKRILVKKSSFQLKKISGILSVDPQVSECQFKIALWLANEYLSPLGLALKASLPPFFLKKTYPAQISNSELASIKLQPEVVVCRAKEVSKHLPVRRLTDGQVLIIVPEMTYIGYFQKLFPDADIIHSSLANKKYYSVWQRTAKSEAQVIIGTRQALFLPFQNLKNIIIIDPLHEFYKSDFSPKYKTPALAEHIANLYGSKLTMISNFLGVENYIRHQKKEIEVWDEMRPWASQIEVIDLVAEIKQGYVGALSVPLKRQISEVVKESGKILIFASRRGYAGIVVCNKCGLTVNCPRCNTPMRVHVAVDKILVCHHCGTNQPYPRFCSNCKSSEIKATGPAGSQKIFEELHKMMEFGQLERIPTLILDADVTQNQTEEDEIMESLRKPGPKILIATQKVFSYIFEDSFDLVAIPQFDALSTSPDYQTTERLWYQLEKLADFQPKKIVIQTYDITRVPDGVFNHDYSKNYTDEAETRADFGYPPFSKIVRLTFSNRSGQTAVKAGRLLIEKLKMAAQHLRIQDHVRISDSSPMFLSKERDFYMFTVIVKLLFVEGRPPQTKLVRELIKYAPSSWLIDVDPRQII